MTAVLDHPVDVAKHYLTDHRACQNCEQPTNDQGTGAWVHTVTGLYRCTPSADVCISGDGFARPYSKQADDEALQEEYEKGEQHGAEIAREEMIDEHDAAIRDAAEKAVEEGRTAMHAEIDAALSRVFDPVLPTDLDPTTTEYLRERLACAWNEVCP
jgi:hypothetical protein